MSREDDFTNSEADAGRYERFRSGRAYDPRDEWPAESDVFDPPKKDDDDA